VKARLVRPRLRLRRSEARISEGFCSVCTNSVRR
jgi:hypothetical protein